MGNRKNIKRNANRPKKAEAPFVVASPSSRPPNVLPKYAKEQISLF
jgi:hypothetical protein